MLHFYIGQSLPACRVCYCMKSQTDMLISMLELEEYIELRVYIRGSLSLDHGLDADQTAGYSRPRW